MRVSIALLIALIGTASAHADGDVPVPGPLAGEAVVVVGNVTASDRTGRHVLQAKTRIPEGTTIDTGADGYLYVVTVDKGFISVRPNSSLTIDRYRYDASAPQRTEIKLVLNRGVVRAISGQGAQASREHYRMNTPVVALGIRGTDFSVFADATTTRAEVRRGGIVLTPFGPDCSPGGRGPCEGPRAAQLFEGERNVLLQFRQGDMNPVALDERFSYLRPDRVSPPRSGEPTAPDATGTRINGSLTPTTVAPGELTFTTPQASVAAPPVQPTPPTEPPPAEPQQLFWGRWAPLAALPANTTVEQLQKQASELVAASQWFAMARTPSADLNLPVAGRFDFKLQGYEAYVVNAAQNTATAAQILNPTLAVDFGQRSFNTRFDVAAGGATYAVYSQGSVTANGKMQSELIGPDVNATVTGALAGNRGTQAGFLFNRPINGGLNAIGATTWSR